MSAPSVTYTFTNGTTIDAGQHNTNFTDLINGASDGTKDYTINSLTANGNLSFSGNGTFGSASGDDLTFNGSLASSIPVKTNASYDIGGATTGLAGVYFGNNTRTTRIVAGVITSSYTLTLPVAVSPVSGYVIESTSGGALSFSSRTKIALTALTNASSPYTVLAADEVITCDATSGAITVTLPSASGVTGKTYLIKKIGTGANAVTVDDFGGTNYLMHAPGEWVVACSNGSAWFALDKYTNGYFGALTTTVNFTNTTVTALYWKRGSNLRGYIKMIQTGTAGAASALNFTLPNSWSADTAKMVFDAANNSFVQGFVSIRDNSVPTTWGGYVNLDSSAPTILTASKLDDTAGGVGIENISNTSPTTFVINDSVILNFEIPIATFEE